MKYYILTLILILLLSAVFRLGFPNETVFLGDECSTAANTLALVKNHELPPLGQKDKLGIFTVGAIYTFPWYVTMLFTHDPRVVTLLTIGVPNTIAVLVCFLFCYKFINKRTAVLATALFGFSGWAILYTKNLWGVNLLQFYSILFFFALSWCIYRPRFWLIVVTILLSIFIPSLHPIGFCVFISVFLILFFHCNIHNKKYLLLLASFLVIPILIVFGKKGLDFISAGFSLDAIFTSMRLIVRDRWYYGYLGVAPGYPLIDGFSNLFVRTMFLLGCVYTVKRTFQDYKAKQFSPYIIIGAWYFVFVVAFGFAHRTSFGHYFVVILPVLFIIAAIGFSAMIDYLSGREKVANWELLVLFIIFMFWNPWLTLLIFSIILFLRGRLITKAYKKPVIYILYFSITFILAFQALSTIQLYSSIKKTGGVSGKPGLDLGSKINTVKYIIKDAQARYKQTGLKSYYSVLNDEGYEYLFEYLMDAQKTDCVAEEKTQKGFCYEIIKDVHRVVNVNKEENYLFHKRIGSKLIIVKKIDET